MPSDAPPIPTLPPDQAKAFRRALLGWYRTSQRDLPWRPRNGQLPNPYHTLVSEAMLQQTQVATVVPYFNRFIEALPTVHALADADEQAVLTLWQGLGYYRRARHLRRAAQQIVEQFGGRVPKTVEQLIGLAGVGRYTAGAIASIAHGTRAAVVDGNVERVLARLLLIEEPVNAPATKNRLWPLAESLVPRARPGDYNQALMELGATVCTPKLPKCFVCPVREHCRGVQETNPERLPIKLAKNKPKDVTHIVLATERKGRYLFEQRPPDGLWSSMWQLPTWQAPPQQAAACIAACGSSGRLTPLITWFRGRFGLALDQPQVAGEFTHPTTHRTIRFVLVHASVTAGRLKPNAGVWRRPDQLDGLPMSNPQHRAVRLLCGLAGPTG